MRTGPSPASDVPPRTVGSRQNEDYRQLRGETSGSFMLQKYMYSELTGNLPYFVYIPLNYQVGKPVPLIVMLHGCTQTATDFAASTRMNELAEQHLFIVAYPQQTTINNHSLCWNWFNLSNQVRGHGEAAMIAGIVQDIEQNKTKWTIDPKRIYLAGLSAGGAMASILGATYPELFAAIGVHSGLGYQAATNMIDGLRAMRRGVEDPEKLGQAAYSAMGSGARVIPVIVFHGTSDHQVHPVNGDKVVQQWIYTNHLASQGTYTATFDEPSHTEACKVQGKRPYTMYAWADANGRQIQQYWKVDGLGHVWSGGGPGSRYDGPAGPDASLAMYQFFIKHQKNVQEDSKDMLWKHLRSARERFLKRYHPQSPETPF